MIIQGRRLFRIFPSKGSDYWKDTVNRRTGDSFKRLSWKKTPGFKFFRQGVIHLNGVH